MPDRYRNWIDLFVSVVIIAMFVGLAIYVMRLEVK